MSSDSFVAQIMSPGGGIILIPFTKAVVICLFLTTATVFCLGVARIHMFILSVLSIGFYFALGKFQREYQAFLDRDETVRDKGQTKVKIAPNNVSKTKRED